VMDKKEASPQHKKELEKLLQGKPLPPKVFKARLLAARKRNRANTP